MPTALPLATAFTDPATTEAQEKTALTNLRAALAEIGDPMGRPGAIQNLSLAFSVGANALTCNVKTRAGATASATDPVSVAMRNVALATGDFIVRNITAALSLVISSGSTLGHANAQPGNIFWYVIDNAGVLELAASTTYFGQQGIITTVAEGGGGAADSATVMYSATARSNVAFRCIGHSIDTQTTAGTWAAVPSTVELSPFDGFLTTLLATGTITSTKDGLILTRGGASTATQQAIDVSNTGGRVIVGVADSVGSSAILAGGTPYASQAGSITGTKFELGANGALVATLDAPTAATANMKWGSGVPNYGTVTKRKTADESVTSSAALQDDDHLTFAIAANEEWDGEIEVAFANALSSTGVKVAVTTPSGATQDITAVCDTYGVSASRAQNTQTSGSALDFLAAQFSAQNTTFVRIKFWVVNGATPGNVTFQFAQSTSSGSPLTARRGGALRATRVA